MSLKSNIDRRDLTFTIGHFTIKNKKVIGLRRFHAHAVYITHGYILLPFVG